MHQEVKQVEATKVEVINPETNSKEEEPKKANVIRRGLNAVGRSCTALKSIFMSLAAAAMGWKGNGPGILAKFGAGFLTILGWLFFTVAWTPAMACGVCEIGAESLRPTNETTETEEENDECSEESSPQ